MEENNKCDHVWANSGLWDGKTPDGQRTGGIMYKCKLCGDKATTMEEIKKKGGSYDKNTDTYGRPVGNTEQ